MEVLVLIGLAVVAAWIYTAGYRGGKREGSRKAYGVGFARGRRSRGRPQGGCLVLVVVGIGLLALLRWLLA